MQDSCMTHKTLDKSDLKILDSLQKDASISLKRLSDICNVSEATCSRRVAALKKKGYLSKEVMLLDRKALGLNLSVFVLVAMEKEHTKELKRFLDRMAKQPSVLSLSMVSGDFDYLMHVICKDMNEYNDFAEIYFADEPSVKKYHSIFDMKTIKNVTALPVDL